MKCLITGGAGFIGSHIVDKLAGKYEVTVLDNFSFGNTRNIKRNIPIICGNILEIEAYKDVIKSLDVLIHCAAQVSTFSSVTEPEETFNNNIFGVFRLYEAVRKHNPRVRIILTSSRSVHGEVPVGTKADEKTPYQTSSNYNLSKIYAEQLAHTYNELYGIDTTIIRPSNVYGSRMPNRGQYGFLCRWISYILNKQPIPIWGSGLQIRDFVYADDVAESYLKCVENPKIASNQTYLLSTGRGHNLLTLVNVIREAVANLNGKTCEKYGKTELKKRRIIELYPAKKGDIQYFVGDSSKIQNDLAVKFRSLEEGIVPTVEWVKNNLERYEDDTGELRK